MRNYFREYRVPAEPTGIFRTRKMFWGFKMVLQKEMVIKTFKGKEDEKVLIHQEFFWKDCTENDIISNRFITHPAVVNRTFVLN